MTTSRQKVGDPLSVHSRNVSSVEARAVDTYVRPAAPKKSKADLLLGALAEANPAFGGVVGHYRDKAIDRETAEGKELYEDNRVAFGEAVRSGKIPAGASPFVRQGYRKSRINVLGAQYNIELQRALEHSNIEAEEDPQAVEAFIRDFDAEFTQVNGIGDLPANEISEIFRPLTDNSQNRFRNQQADRNIAFVEEQRTRSFEQELYMAVSQGRFTGPPGSASADAKSLGDWLQLRANEMWEEGISHEVIERSILTTVGEVALQNGSLSTASLLDGISVGGMPTIGSSAAGRNLDRQISSAIASQERAAHNRANAEVTETTRENKRSLAQQAQEAAMNGDIDRARELTAELNLLDPTAARSVDGFVRRYEGDVEDSAEEGAYAFTRDAVAGAGSASEGEDLINEGIISGNLSNESYERLHRLNERLHGSTEEVSPLDALETDRTIKDQRGRFASSYPAMDEWGQIAIPANADLRANAEDSFDDYMIDWLSANTNEDGHYDRLAARQAARDARDQALLMYPPVGTSSPETTPPDDGGDPSVPDWALD